MMEILKTASPFTVGSAANAPEGHGVQRAVGSMIGLPTYGHQKRAFMDLDEQVEYDKLAKSKREANLEAKHAIELAEGKAAYKALTKTERQRKIQEKKAELGR
jgi:hypothetical protein